VLGSSGYIGSRLVANLQAKGYQVWAPKRGDTQIFRRPLGHVVYCVGLTADFRVRPLETVDAHVGVLAEVLRCSQFDSLLYLSSTRVYMGAGSTDEDSPLTVFPGDPSSLYNLTKLTGESLCHTSGRPGVRVVRLSNVVGPRMEEHSSNLVSDLLRQARRGLIVLRSHPCSAKDYIHVEDVVEWLPAIALDGKQSIYNVASGIQTTHAQWLQWLSCAYASRFEIQDAASVQSFLPINVQRLQTEFDVRARPVWDGAAPW
jgi:nucleoside-diphosphate-sugar epimerase